MDEEGLEKVKRLQAELHTAYDECAMLREKVARLELDNTILRQRIINLVAPAKGGVNGKVAA